MSRPLVLPDWATDATFSGGPIAGQPNKAAPSGGMVTEGWDPTDPLAAEHLNYMFWNAGQWIDHHDDILLGPGIHLLDDFSGTTVSTDLWATITGSPALVADAGSTGGYGAIQCDVNSGGTASKYVRSQLLGIGVGDFFCGARVRVPSMGPAGNANRVWMGLQGGSPSSAQIQIIADKDVDSTHWASSTGTAGSPTTYASSVTFGSTYAYLSILRVSGTVYFFIDGTLFNQEANTDDFASGFFTIGAVTSTDACEARFDVAKLWAAR